MTRTGGHALVDQLLAEGADTVFNYPGESYLAVLDGLYEHRDAIQLVSSRHEAGASNMAEAYGKLTGRPGIVLVNRGPGAAQASVGVHTAKQDSTPMIVLIGQGPRAFLGRESFQEIDHRVFMGAITKWTGRVESADEIPAMVRRAHHTALSGRPGPVALELPEDVLTTPTAVPTQPVEEVDRPVANESEVAAALDLLSTAERPLMIIGGSSWSETAAGAVRTFTEANHIPVVVSFRRQDYIDNDSSSYIGYTGLAVHPVVAGAISEADVILAIGTRLGDVATSGYRLIEVEVRTQRLIHVHVDAGELGSVHSPDLAINSDSAAFATALAEAGNLDSRRWVGRYEAMRAEYERNLVPVEAPGQLNLAAVVRHVSDHVPRDAIVTNGAGNFTVWAHRYHSFHEFRTQLGPTSGSMGYGIPAAVAAKIRHPDRVVVGWTGDGDASMSINELAVAIEHGVNPIFLVVNNGMLATMRMHQERRYPGRVLGSGLVNPDFVALGKAFGANAEAVERTEDFPAAFDRALESPDATVLDLRLDPEQITPTTTLMGERRRGEEAQSST